MLVLLKAILFFVIISPFFILQFATANFFVNPEAAQVYLIKTECFCFTEQTLKPGESQIFTMIFYVDPSLDSDWYFNDLKDLVFTYEFSEYKS